MDIERRLQSNNSPDCASVVGADDEFDLSLGIAGSIYLITFGSINIIFYVSVMVTLAKNWDHFTNPFHKCMVALGVCDLYILVYVNLYSPMSVLAGRRLFGFYVDAILGSFYYAANWTAHELQILYAFNRFCGVVLFKKYKTIFKPENLKLMIGACYFFGIGSVGFWLLYGLPLLDLNMGTTLFSFVMDQYDSVGLFFLNIFEGLIVAMPVVLVMITLYPIAFVYIRKRHRTPSSLARRRLLSTETKLLIVGFTQALFFLFGYLNFMILGCRVPFWLNFHFYELYVAASPYLYLMFDLRLRQFYWRCFVLRQRTEEGIELRDLQIPLRRPIS